MLFSDIAGILGHTDTKVISDVNLAGLVRQIAIHCNVSRLLSTYNIIQCNFNKFADYMVVFNIRYRLSAFLYTSVYKYRATFPEQPFFEQQY